jgi:pimeloyl-ACP methyl ester carboxylesterase
VSLLGHSYGAHCALIAASLEPHLVRRLVVYEPAWPELIPQDALASLDALAAAGAWDAFAYAFFANVLKVPTEELDALRDSDGWPPIVADAPASLHDLRAMHAYRFDADRFRELHMPVQLQVGSESPRHFYVTDALLAALPNARVQSLPGQAHEGMTTAPALYVEKTLEFLLPEFSLEEIG